MYCCFFAGFFRLLRRAQVAVSARLGAALVRATRHGTPEPPALRVHTAPTRSVDGKRMEVPQNHGHGRAGKVSMFIT